MGGIGPDMEVGRGDFGGNGNMGRFCLGFVDLGFGRWGGGRTVGKGLGIRVLVVKKGLVDPLVGMEIFWWGRKVFFGNLEGFGFSSQSQKGSPRWDKKSGGFSCGF